MRLLVATTVLAVLPGCNVLLGIGAPSADSESDLRIDISGGQQPSTVTGFTTVDIVVTNDGPDDSAEATVVVELSPGAFFGPNSACGSATGRTSSCLLPSLPPNMSVARRLSVTIIDATVTATVTSARDTDPTNNAAMLTIKSSADLDMGMHLDGYTEVVGAGRVVPFWFLVTNKGPGTASTMTLTITASPGVVPQSASGVGWSCTAWECTAGSLPPGGMSRLEWDAVTPSVAGSIRVTGTVSSTTPDLISANNVAWHDKTVSLNTDAAVTLSATPDPVAPGGTLTYTLAVRSYGPSPASSVTVTDTLPAGVTFVSATGSGWTCSLSGQDVTCTRPTLDVALEPIDLVVTAPATAGTITNTAVLTTTSPDTNANNDAASITTTVGP